MQSATTVAVKLFNLNYENFMNLKSSCYTLLGVFYFSVACHTDDVMTVTDAGKVFTRE